MQITLISQCEKSARARTRLVLDSFAERIGDNAWQTIITAEGLDALHTELRKTASKSTAVACHYQRSRTRSQLLWVVGKKHEFNAAGQVPVNETDSNTSQFMDKEKWKTLDIMKIAVGIAGLFHDFGKANDLFQRKLDPIQRAESNSEPLRHEWISLHLFACFISGFDTDAEWLDALEEISTDTPSMSSDRLSEIDFLKTASLAHFPPLAQLIGWLILSHHKLPAAPVSSEIEIEHIDEWLKRNLVASWNSPQILNDDDEERLKQVTTFSHGLPNKSPKWRCKAMEYASEAKRVLKENPITTSLLHQRFTIHHARLALMLADHYYSSRPCGDPQHQWESYKPIANTDQYNQRKQSLDEHNIAVAIHAREIIETLPGLSRSLNDLDINLDSVLEKKISKSNEATYLKFGWQNATIKTAEKIRKEARGQGFFGVNMASTGKGKTIANAKILHALGSTRFNVALGLRTLTLQTGTSFQKDLELDDENLATLVGGIAVKELYELNLAEDAPFNGSESAEDITDLEVGHQFKNIVEHDLSEWTDHDQRIEKLLSAPVLVSTIDHLIPATEGTRGGKQIGPMLRLLTSDLILDEPDDFGLEDLPALCRLVNWAGMLGSKVLLSSATMPPSLVNALFRAYQQGRQDYLSVNGTSSHAETIACAWFDENQSTHSLVTDQDAFKKAHKKYTEKRVAFLKKEKCLKRGEILKVKTEPNQAPSEIIKNLAETIRAGIEQLHNAHKISRDGVSLSVGLVRMANIDPLVAVSKEIMEIATPDNTQLHYCVYHSRFPLAVRSHLENKLDGILKRTDEEAIWEHPDIKSKLENSPEKKNHIFVVLASPVAEVGRDHDYDWAIAEPSSMRSIIQLSGRVLRHRSDKSINADVPNILILQKNYKGFKEKSPCFKYPGFESSLLRTASTDLLDLLLPEQYVEIDSSARIEMPSFSLNVPSFDNLVNLEHAALIKTLFHQEISADLWWEKEPTWCGNLQFLQRFRNSRKTDEYCLILDHSESVSKWYQVNHNAIRNKYVITDKIAEFSYHPPQGLGNSFWFNLNENDIFQDLQKQLKRQESLQDFAVLCKRYGTLLLTEHESWLTHPQLGTFNELPE